MINILLVKYTFELFHYFYKIVDLVVKFLFEIFIFIIVIARPVLVGFIAVKNPVLKLLHSHETHTLDLVL